MKKQRLFRGLLLCFSTVFSLLLGEAVLGFALPKVGYVWSPGFEMIFKPNPNIMPGTSGSARFAINSVGLRGDELTPAHTYRILAIGGSTTQCSYLDQSETWSYLVQQTLTERTSHNVWVGNAGMDGRTTRHHLTAMQYLPLREMRIDTIILLIGANDFGARLKQDDGYDPNFLAKPEAASILFNQTFTARKHLDIIYPTDPFYKTTVLWQMQRKLKRLVLEKIDPYTIQDQSGEIYITWRKHRQQAAEMRNELPDLSSALEEYARNINKMIDIAQEESVRLIFMTQPTMWKSNLPVELEGLLWLGGIGNFMAESGKVYYSAGALEKGMDKYNSTLLSICRERQVECIDLSSILEKDTTVSYDDDHFNEGGARKVATILSNYLLRRDPFR